MIGALVNRLLGSGDEEGMRLLAGWERGDDGTSTAVSGLAMLAGPISVAGARAAAAAASGRGGGAGGLSGRDDGPTGPKL